MARNLPEEIAAKVAIATQLKTLGISMETILDLLPFVKDVKKELKKIDEQKQKLEEEEQEQASRNRGGQSGTTGQENQTGTRRRRR